MFNDRNNLLIYSIFLIFFFICLIVIKDYGVSQDEYVNRIHGFVTLKYIGNLILPDFTQSIIGDKKIHELNNEYVGKSYGSYYSSFIGLIEIVFQIDDKYNQFLLRHYINFSIFFLSLIFFYKTLMFLTNSKSLSLIGLLSLGLFPRIFAESFYNTIDMFFLSIVIISNFFFVKLYLNANIKNLLISSLFTALVIDHRIVGTYFLIQNLFFLFMLSKIELKYKRNIFFYPILYLFTSIIFIYLFWPFLWSDPINNFLIAFKENSKWDYIVRSLFNGQHYLSDQLPFYYVPQWILITTPFFFILFFFMGIFYIFKNLSKHFKSNLKNFNLYLYFFLIVFGHFIAIFIMQPNLYNGWRHFYYIYPSILVIGIYGFKNLIIKNYKLKLAITSLAVINILYLLIWNFSNHPNQQVYFNLLAGKNFNEKFDMDYWALTNKQQLLKILENENSKTIKIYNLSENKIFYSLFSLNGENRNKFSIVNEINKADYVITNYYNLDEKQKKELKLLQNFERYNDIIVDNVVISSLFINPKKDNNSK